MALRKRSRVKTPAKWQESGEHSIIIKNNRLLRNNEKYYISVAMFDKYLFKLEQSCVRLYRPLSHPRRVGIFVTIYFPRLYELLGWLGF